MPSLVIAIGGNSITKAGVNRLTETLAVEWSRFGINVNAIAPGLFASEMSDGMIERMGDLTRAFPRKRIGQPEHLDSTLLYLRQVCPLDPSELQVGLRVTLVDRADARVIASQTLQVSEPLEERTPYAGVLAANRALARLLGDLQAFLAEHAGRGPG